jgi:hypothetical protein
MSTRMRRAGSTPRTNATPLRRSRTVRANAFCNGKQPRTGPKRKTCAPRRGRDAHDPRPSNFRQSTTDFHDQQEPDQDPSASNQRVNAASDRSCLRTAKTAFERRRRHHVVAQLLLAAIWS